MFAMRAKPEKIEGFGERLKNVLKITKVSQRELSDMLFINQSSVSGYIRGKVTPRIERIDEICSVLGVDAKYLVCGDEDALQDLIDACEEGDAW